MSAPDKLFLPDGSMLVIAPDMAGEEGKFPAYDDLTIRNAPEWYGALHSAFALLCQQYDAVAAESREFEAKLAEQEPA